MEGRWRVGGGKVEGRSREGGVYVEGDVDTQMDPKMLKTLRTNCLKSSVGFLQLTFA